MDFRQTVQPNNTRPAASTPPANTAQDEGKKVKEKSENNMSSATWMKVFTSVMLVGIAVLLSAVAVGVGHGRSNDNESQFVDSTKYQAVFLNNGQVYFGHISNLNAEYLRMSGIYYLTSAGSGSSNYTLVKLGCQQIHDPTDAMLINRSQVTFWENIKSDGQVGTSIDKFRKQNPKGPDCSQVSTQTQASSSNAQGASDTTGTNSNTTTK